MIEAGCTIPTVRVRGQTLTVGDRVCDSEPVTCQVTQIRFDSSGHIKVGLSSREYGREEWYALDLAILLITGKWQRVPA